MFLVVILGSANSPDGTLHPMAFDRIKLGVNQLGEY